MKRLPPTKPLSEILPKGREGGSEFARIVDLLLFYDARLSGDTINLFSDRSGDWHGLDSFGSSNLRISGRSGYQYKFYPSPLSKTYRREIAGALQKASESRDKSSITKWILVTPDDLVESATKKNGGDVTWFNSLAVNLKPPFEIEHWGHTKLQALFLQAPPLCLFYYPELVTNGPKRRAAISSTRKQYDVVLGQKFGRIEFVGMSVRKEEASRGVKMGEIYIPLALVAEGTDQTDQTSPRTDPLNCLVPGQRTVILGDPGSGKSTLLRFFALVGQNSELQKRCNAKSDNRLPILVTLRKYADELKSNYNLPLLDFILQTLQAEYSNPDITLDFLLFYIEAGHCVFLFDGVDELPDTNFKLAIRDRIQALASSYPGNAVVVTSRIVGYEQEARFDGDCPFAHRQVAPLREREIKQFAKEWHQARVEDKQERDQMVSDLIKVLADPENHAISELACNPLLLTIIVLVHRIDAVLSDQRVLLYQKCVETLLITWHTWKYRSSVAKRQDREDRRNLRRMEAIAEWMHDRAGQRGREQRAVVSFEELIGMLVDHIRTVEKWSDEKGHPEDEAADFLSFVRQKAGLLVEAGTNLYSFVHLTFQEYLAARHIITCSEARGGDTFVWNKLKDRVSDPRWSEVIRLLIAARDSEESQRNLLNSIFNARIQQYGVASAALLAGLLIDRVPAAEERRTDVLQAVWVQMAHSPDESAALLPMLAILTTRVENLEALTQAFALAWATLPAAGAHRALLITALACPLKDDFLAEWIEVFEREDYPTCSLISTLLVRTSAQVIDQETNADWDFFTGLLDRLAHRNPAANLISAILCSIFPTHQLISVLALQFSVFVSAGSPGDGPFTDFTANLLTLFDHLNSFGKISEIIRRERHDHGLNSNAELVEILEETRKRFRRPISLKRSEYLENLVHRISDIDPGIKIRRAKTTNSLWSSIGGDEQLQDAVIQVVVEGFRLSPETIWREALRMRLISSIRKHHAVLNRAPELSLSEEAPIEAAIWLMIDIWRYEFSVPNGPQDSPVMPLSHACRQTSDPVLKFVTALHQIVVQKSPELELLRKTAEAPSPELAAFFKLAFGYGRNEMLDKVQAERRPGAT